MSVFMNFIGVQSKANKIGFVSFAIHIALFFMTLLYVNFSSDPQASLIWAYFSLIDFPVSLLYAASFLNSIVYMPYLVHGVLGALWWYFLPRLFMPRRMGGIWNSRSKSEPRNLHTTYSVLGMILLFSGLGLNRYFGANYIGILMFLFGLFFMMKGADIFYKIIPPKPWSKGPY